MGLRVLAFLLFLPAQGADECRPGEAPREIAKRFASSAAQRKRDDRATQIWLEREVLDAVGRKSPVGFVNYQASRVPRSEVKILWADGVDPEFRQAVEAAFFDGDFVLWPHHPDHQPPNSGPFGKLPRENWRKAHRTGSRSSVVRLEGSVRYLGIKLPRGLSEGDPKANISPDIQGSLPMSNWMAYVDERLSKIGRSLPPNVIALRDVVAFVDTKSGNGFLVRDIRPITTGTKEGQFWLPAYSVEDHFPLSKPDLEAGIARVNAYALVHYGYWPTSPHNQQYLYQCPCPRGVVRPTAMRDWGDGKLSISVLRALGENEMIQGEEQAHGLAHQFDLSAREVLAPETNPRKLLREEVFRILGFEETPETRLKTLEDFMASPLGQAAIRRYHGLPQSILPALPRAR